MSCRLPVALGLGALALSGLMACPTRPTEGPPPIHVPPGCEQSQAGQYHHAANPAFRYLGQDDGRILSLTLVRGAEDGGVEQAPDAGAITVMLARTPEGFVGMTHALGFSVSGTPCPVKFPTQVTACAADALTLRTAQKTYLNEDCRPPPSGPVPQWTEQVLRRGPPPAPSGDTADGGVGTPDAGTPDAGTADGGLLTPPGAAPRKS